MIEMRVVKTSPVAKLNGPNAEAAEQSLRSLASLHELELDCHACRCCHRLRPLRSSYLCTLLTCGGCWDALGRAPREAEP